MGCGICVKNCQHDAVKVENFHAVIDPEKCVGCGACMENARKVYCKSIKRVQEEKDMRLPDDYEDHGGGLTPTVVSAIVAVTIFVVVILTVVLIINRKQPSSSTEQYNCTDGECTTGRK